MLMCPLGHRFWKRPETQEISRLCSVMALVTSATWLASVLCSINVCQRWTFDELIKVIPTCISEQWCDISIQYFHDELIQSGYYWKDLNHWTSLAGKPQDLVHSLKGLCLWGIKASVLSVWSERYTPIVPNWRMTQMKMRDNCSWHFMFWWIPWQGMIMTEPNWFTLL